MTRAVLILVTLLALCLSCGDDEPSRAEACTDSCESRGGKFYLMDGEYCYCQWTQSDAGTD